MFLPISGAEAPAITEATEAAEDKIEEEDEVVAEVEAEVTVNPLEDINEAALDIDTLDFPATTTMVPGYYTRTTPGRHLTPLPRHPPLPPGGEVEGKG